MATASKILIPVLALAVVVGAAGVWERLASGKEGLALGSYVPWGLWVGLYIYLIGASGGAFLIAFLHFGLGVGRLERAARYALPVALMSLGAALVLVLLDLGQMWRFWHLFTRTSFGSLLGAMVWVYTVYAVVLMAMVVALARGRTGTLRWLSLAGAGLVFVFGGGEGALFGVVGAKSIWNSGIVPIRFLVSGAAAGLALVALAVVLFPRRAEDAAGQAERRLLRGGLLALLATIVVLEFAELSVTLYAGIPAISDVYRLMLFGSYWWVFWVLQLGVGVVLAGALLVAPIGRRPLGLGLGALAIAIGLAGMKQNVVLPALAIPEFRTLPEAFVHGRLSVTYFPSPLEWAVAVGVVGAAALAVVLAVELLPFLRPAPSEEWRSQA